MFLRILCDICSRSHSFEQELYYLQVMFIFNLSILFDKLKNKKTILCIFTCSCAQKKFKRLILSVMIKLIVLAVHVNTIILCSAPLFQLWPGKNNILNQGRCVKSVRIRSHSGPYFPAFEQSKEGYGVSLHIQSECRKIWTKINPNTDIFHAVGMLTI